MSRFPLFVPSLLEQSLAGRPTPWSAPSASAIRCCSSLRPCGGAIDAGRVGDIDEMDRCFEIAGVLADQLDQPLLNWAHLRTLPARALIAGDTDRAEQLATEALQIGTDSGEPDAAVFFAIQPLASLQRGTMGDLVPSHRAGGRRNPGLRLFPACSRSPTRGAHGDARRLLEEFAAAGFDLPMDVTWLTAWLLRRAAIECRDAEYARPLFDRLAPWADLVHPTSAPRRPVSHYLGGLATVLGRYDEADAYFAHARRRRTSPRQVLRRPHQPLLGKDARRRSAPGDVDTARELLTDAQTAAAAHGYANVERRAAGALQHLD